MPDQPRNELADYLVGIEIDRHIRVEEEDSVRVDWWRASCDVHDWYTTGHKPIVENAAAKHVARDHPPCLAPSDRVFAGKPLYCRMMPNHGDDHANGGYTWPNMPDPTAPAPALPHTERYLCPISTCSWAYDTPPVPVIDPGVLAHIFGTGVMGQQAVNQRHAEIERALQEHFGTHTIAEYVAEIGSLTGLVIGLTAQIAALTELKRHDQGVLDDLAGPHAGFLGPAAGL